MLGAMSLLSLTFASSPSILCSLHIYCLNSTAVTTNSNSTLASNSILNSTSSNTIASNATNSSQLHNLTSEGYIKLIYASAREGQYTFKIILPNKNLTGIYGFALLGKYGTKDIFIPALMTNCTITANVTCTSAYVLNLGNYYEMEVTNNGKWLYAISLPYAIITPSQQPPTIYVSPPPNYLGDVELGVVAGLSILVVGNVIYYKLHEEELYNVSGEQL